MLTAERLRALLDYDAATGLFHWSGAVRHARRTKPGGQTSAKPDRDGYLRIGVDGKKHRAHQLAWLWVHGVWPSHEVDHINGNKADNRIENLRDVPRQINSQNTRRALVTNMAGLQGVWTPRGRTKKFAAYIVVDGARRRLGSFDTADQAHAAYVAAKRELHAGCTI